MYRSNGTLQDNKYVKIFGYCLFLVLLIAFISSFVKSCIIKNTGIVINGEISNYSKGGRSETITIFYKYSYNGKSYEKARGMNGILYSNGDKFLYRHFPVLFSKLINSGTLLLTPDDFKKYGREFPDSLNWIFQYYYNK